MRAGGNIKNYNIRTMCTTKFNEASIMLAAIIGLTLFERSIGCGGRTMIRTSGVSEYEKQMILDMHNRMRQSVALGQVGGQPPASNMMEMKWDAELAVRAQRWAMSCYSEKHDPGRHVSRFPVGQNIATMWTTRRPSTINDMEADFADAIGKWFREFRSFRFGGVQPGGNGHYTQMVWAETHKVGCGFAFYYDRSKGFTKNHICNYGPGGNVLGQAPYHKGYPNCVDNGLVDSRKYHGLCDKPGNYFYGISNYIG